MKLKTYLHLAKKESGLTHKEFAEKAEISAGYLQELLALKKQATPKVAKRIEAASGGLVPAIELVKAFYSANSGSTESASV